jgi:outer membrane lipoprotein SlyB
MENTTKAKSNPVFVIAAIAITLFSALGIGAITGLIPSSFSKNDASKAAANSTAKPSDAMKAPVPVVASVDTAKLQAEPKADAALSKAEDKVLQPVAPETKVAPAPERKPVAAAPKPVPHKPAAPKTVVANNTYTTAPASAPVVSQPYTAPAPVQVAAAPVVAQAPAPIVCNNCGVVEAINAVQQQGDASGVGAVLGGVAGGVVGHQVGSGRGRDLATVLGAVGGAVAGNQVEKAKKATSVYDVVVRMNDNSTRTVRATTNPDYGVGQKVKVVDGQVVRN